MTQAYKTESGELSSFLHLTGKRPLIVAFLAGLAGAIGLFLALGEPSQWVSRYVVNVSRVAEDGLQPAQLDILAEEIAQTMVLPDIVNTVERETGLVLEEDYEITSGQSPSAISLINVTAVADTPENSQAAAFETSLAALVATIDSNRAGVQTTADQLQDAVNQLNIRIAELTSVSGGVNPVTAYDRAVNNLLIRRELIENPTCTPVTDPDGLVECVPDAIPEPPVAELEVAVQTLEPVQREFTQLLSDLNETSVRLAERQASVRSMTGALQALGNERANNIIINEVETDQASRISGLLTGLLLFAIPVALLLIATFFVIDAFRKPSDVTQIPGAPEANRALQSSNRRALPEATVTPLVRADGEEPYEEATPQQGEDLHGHGGEDLREEAVTQQNLAEEDAEPKEKKDNRWGRDTKAG